MPDRLEMVVGGQRQIALPTTDLKSHAPQWSGFLMERHQFGPFEMPDHWIPFYMVNLQMVRKPGKRFFFEGGREHVCPVHRGDCVIVAPHEVRKFRFAGEGDTTLVSIEPSVLQSMLSGSASRNRFELLRRWNGDDPVLRDHLLRLQADVAAGCPSGPLLGESICTRLAEELLERYSMDRPKLDQYKGGLSGAQLKYALGYIDASLSSNLTGAGIAEMAGLSKYHFGKAFKQSTGMTLHSYVLARRMWRAQELLAKSDLPLASVAQAAGFSSQSHFTAIFSTRMGFSPGSYRRLTRPVSVFLHSAEATLKKAAST